jgi:hypothetical protein
VAPSAGLLVLGASTVLAGSACQGIGGTIEYGDWTFQP